MSTQLEKCTKFLDNNGFELCAVEDGIFHYSCPNSGHAIDVESDSIVFCDDNGDYAEIPTNVYALIGALVHFRLICAYYKKWD